MLEHCRNNTDVSEELIASTIWVKRISYLGTIPETSAPTRATRRHIPEDIIHSDRRENLKSYIALTG
jgi:homoserine kinase